MTSVADFIMDAFVKNGGQHAFCVPGGHSMYLNEAADFHPQLEVIYTHHEQAAAVAASAYFHASKTPALVLCTAGPGVANVWGGIAAAYLDAVPVLVISGQMKRDDLHTRERPTFAPMLSTIELVKSITTYAVLVSEPSKIKGYMTEAFKAMSGGPAWLDIPLDVQAAAYIPTYTNFEYTSTS